MGGAKSLPSTLRTKTGCLLTLRLFNTVLEILAQTIRQEAAAKGMICTGNEKVMLLLFADVMILYVEDPKNLPKDSKH